MTTANEHGSNFAAFDMFEKLHEIQFDGKLPNSPRRRHIIRRESGVICTNKGIAD